MSYPDVDIGYIPASEDGTWDNPNIQGRSHVRGILNPGWALCLEYQAVVKGWTQEEIAADVDGVVALLADRYDESIWGGQRMCRWCAEVAGS